MTKEEKEKYEEPELLREILERTLSGRKFQLHCGHFVTWNHQLGNNVTILNGKKLRLICSMCGH